MVFDLGIGCATLKEIKKIISAEGQVPDSDVLRIVTHSSEVQKGDLFCVLGDAKGYIDEVVARGASALLSPFDLSFALPSLLVKDVSAALGKWAAAVLKGHPARRIAITGSVGKTGTKNALSHLFSSRLRTHANIGNYNNLLGVSFTVLSMPKDTEILITEMGTNQKGEIAALSEIVEPSDAVITCIGTAHLAAFLSREEIAKEKLGILRGMRGGRLFYPFDEPLLREASFGEVTPVAVHPYKKYEENEAKARAVGFAQALGVAYGITGKNAENILSECALRAERRVLIQKAGITLIDDAYNASPESMRCAFRFLEAEASGRRILALGDMLELGGASHALHVEIGKAAACYADLIFLYGNFKEAYAHGIKATRSDTPLYLIEAKSEKEAAYAILPQLKRGDTVLFKSSNAAGGKKILSALIGLLDASPPR